MLIFLSHWKSNIDWTRTRWLKSMVRWETDTPSKSLVRLWFVISLSSPFSPSCISSSPDTLSCSHWHPVGPCVGFSLANSHWSMPTPPLIRMKWSHTAPYDQSHAGVLSPIHKSKAFFIQLTFTVMWQNAPLHHYCFIKVTVHIKDENAADVYTLYCQTSKSF